MWKLKVRIASLRSNKESMYSSIQRKRNPQVFLLHDNWTRIDDVLFGPSTFSFFFARHPFDRIVSAYNNKLIGQNHNDWQNVIPMDFEGTPNETRKYPGKPTVEEMLRFGYKVK